jgi:L-ribulokinase
LIALDWNGGNRSVLVNAELSGLLVGQTLVTRPEQIYRALLESTAFGTRMIVDTFNAAGVPVSELVVAGGLLKNPQLMQTYSDVLGMPISTAVSTQGPALGSAIHAAVAAGAYPNVRAAGESMGRVLKNAYEPNPADVEAYAAIYADYRELHDLFGRGSLDVMKRAKTRRKVALS